jgi:hypothetical protein
VRLNSPGRIRDRRRGIFIPYCTVDPPCIKDDAKAGAVYTVSLFGESGGIPWNSGIFDQSTGNFNEPDIPVLIVSLRDMSITM